MSTRARAGAPSFVACAALVAACGAFSADDPRTPAADAGSLDAAITDDAAAAPGDGGVASADGAPPADAAKPSCADQPFAEGFEGGALDPAWAVAGSSDIDFLLSSDHKASGAQALRVTVQTAPSDHGRKLQRPIHGKCVDVTWAMFVPATLIPDGTTVLSIDLGSGEQLFAFISGTRLALAEQGGGKPQVLLGDLPLLTSTFATFHLHLEPGNAAGLQGAVAFSTGTAAFMKSTSRAFADTSTATLAIGAPFVYAGRQGEVWFDDVVAR